MPGSVRPLEKSIQESVVKYARSRGVIAIKQGVSRFGSNGWPDFLFLLDGRALLIEFKKPGGKATPLQLQRIAELQANGTPALIVDDPWRGRMTLDEFIAREKIECLTLIQRP